MSFRSRSALRRAATGLAGLATLASFGLLAAPVATATTSITGPDVADYQHPNGAAINWTKVEKSGADFAIVKATEGDYYTNSYFKSDYAGAAKAGLVHGSYAFARPATPIASSASSQASYFAKEIGAVTTTKTLPPALDLEVTGGLTQQQLIHWAQLFLLDVRSATGRTPMLYTYPTFWSETLDDPAAFTRYPVWMAAYSSSKPAGATLWQYTSTDTISGIKGHVDNSRYVGTTAWPWSTISNGTVATPWTASVPGVPQQVSATLNETTGDGGSATVRWLPGDSGTSPITGYTVSASAGGFSEQVSSNTNSATLTGLVPGTSYTFTVTASNKTGTSLPSAKTNVVEPLVGTAMVVSSTATGVAAKQPVTLTGTLTRTDTLADLAGDTVTLLRQSQGSSSWSTVSSQTTDANGAVSFTRRPTTNTKWEFSYAGGGGFAASTETATTKVRPIVTIAGPSSVVENDWFTISGTIAPSATDLTVEREIYSSAGTWVVKQKHTVTGEAFTFSLRQKSVGTSKYRIVVLAGDSRQGNATHPLKVTSTVAPASTTGTSSGTTTTANPSPSPSPSPPSK